MVTDKVRLPMRLLFKTRYTAETHAKTGCGNATLNYERTACVYTPFSNSLSLLFVFTYEKLLMISQEILFLSLIISFFNLYVAYVYFLPSGADIKGPKSVNLLYNEVAINS